MAKAGKGKARGAGRSRSKQARRGRAQGPSAALLRARRVGLVVVTAAFVAGVSAALWLVSLDRVVVSRFEGRRFDVPSRVYAAPIVIYPGADWQRLDLAGWLTRMGYREQQRGRPPGTVGQLPMATRAGCGFIFVASNIHSSPSANRKVEFRLEAGPCPRHAGRAWCVPSIVVALEPEPISSFYGTEREQRDLVRDRQRCPAHLVDAIFSVEDRRFEDHHGDGSGFASAVRCSRTCAAGGIRQGGSTLTQQLVKNFFLTPERTLRRKLTEAVMALMVEARYEKHADPRGLPERNLPGSTRFDCDPRRGRGCALLLMASASRISSRRRVRAARRSDRRVRTAMSPHRHPERARRSGGIW